MYGAFQYFVVLLAIVVGPFIDKGEVSILRLERMFSYLQTSTVFTFSLHCLFRSEDVISEASSIATF